jgi:hypothetical protein
VVTLYNKEDFVPPCIPDSHPHRITRTECRISTVVSPDDGPIDARNMYRLINTYIYILRISYAPRWFYLQDYTEMHGQQNIKVRGQFGGSEENYEQFLA